MPESPIYPMQAVAENLRRLRRLRRLSQEDIAARMTALGYGRGGKPGGRPADRAGAWNRSTTGEIERGARELTTNELVGLSLILGVTLGEMLDPGERSVYLGDTLPPDLLGVDAEGSEPAPTVRSELAREWFASRVRGEITEVEENRLRSRFSPVKGRLSWEEWLSVAGVDLVREVMPRHQT